MSDLGYCLVAFWNMPGKDLQTTNKVNRLAVYSARISGHILFSLIDRRPIEKVTRGNWVPVFNPRVHYLGMGPEEIIQSLLESIIGSSTYPIISQFPMAPFFDV